MNRYSYMDVPFQKQITGANDTEAKLLLKGLADCARTSLYDSKDDTKQCHFREFPRHSVSAYTT